MSSYAEKCRTYYEKGFYNEAMLAKLVTKGKLTQEEYDEIVETEND